MIEQTLGDRLMGELLLALSPWPVLDIGLAMPVALMGSGEEREGHRFTGVGDVTGFHVGQARAAIKLNAYRAARWGVAMVADSTLPTADEGALMGNGLGFGGRLVADVSMGPMLLAMNAGVYMRGEEGQINDLELGNELYLGGQGASRFPTGTAYATAMQEIVACARKELPTARICACGQPGSAWAKEVAKQKELFDAVSLHVYSPSDSWLNNSGSTQEDQLTSLADFARGLMAKAATTAEAEFGSERPIWMTEVHSLPRLHPATILHGR